MQVIETVNHPYLHALPDLANSMATGNPDLNYRALQAMFEHAYSICHVKDGEAGDDGKLFSIDMKKSFATLKASGYRAYCSMEFDAPGDPYAPTARLIEQAIQYLSWPLSNHAEAAWLPGSRSRIVSVAASQYCFFPEE